MVTLLLGAFVGIVLGLTGAGGSIIAVPLLMVTLGWTLPQAAPVALLAVAMAATIGAVTAWRQNLVRYRAATLMVIVGWLTTPIGVAAAHRLPASVLSILFSAVLALVAVRLLLQARRMPEETRIVAARLDGGDAGKAVCRVNPESGRIRWNSPCAAALASTGAMTGVLSGLLGVGGGFIIVPALRKATELTMHGAVATSLMVIALVSTGAAIGALAHGAVIPVAVGVPFVGGAMLGMGGGRVLAPKIAGPALQSGFAVLVLVIASGLTVKALGLI